MQEFVELVKGHLSKWEVEYLCLACYAAGSFGLFGKIVKALAKYAS